MPSKGKGRSARKRSAASDDGAKSEKAHGDGASSAKRRDTSPSRKVDAPYSTATRTTRSHATVSAAASVAPKNAVKKKTNRQKAAGKKTTPSKIVKQKTASKAGKAVAAKKAVTTKKQKGQSAASNKSAVSPQPQDADIHPPIQILAPKSTTTLDSFEIPRRITFKKSQKSSDRIHCLLYLRDGRLLSGVYGGINGFITNFTLGLKDVSSFCEYDNQLFVLSDHGGKFRVHVVNVTNQTIQESIITCKMDAFGQIAVNEHYIGITDSGLKCVKIFSAMDYSHLYDIKDDVGEPLAFLNDNVVFSDCCQNVVTCATLNSKSEVLWKNRNLAQPHTIRVCSQVLLIGAADSHQIYVLSHEGQTLSVFDVPECSGGILDIAVFGKQLAVGASKGIKVYEIEDDEEFGR